MKLALYNFNNYFDRKYKKFDTLEGYEPYFIDYAVTLNNETADVNYDPKDGVLTSITLQLWGEDWGRETFPDYCIFIDDSNNIVSRWFILEADRKNNGCYIIQVRRDVLADYSDEELFPNGNWLNAPAYIERAIVNPNSPFVFNKEPLTYNQIKKGEYYITDDTDDCWFVGYVAKGEALHSGELEINVDGDIYASFNEGEDLPFPTGTDIKVPSTYEYIIRSNTLPNVNTRNYRFTQQGYISNDLFGFANQSRLTETSQNPSSTARDTIGRALFNAYSWSTVNGYINSERSYTVDTSFLQYKDKTIKVGANYYKVEVSQEEWSEGHDAVPGNTLQNYIVNNAPEEYFYKASHQTAEPKPNTFSYTVRGTKYQVTLASVTAPGNTYTIGQGETYQWQPKRTCNAVYDMFCVQAPDSKRETLMYIMSDIARQLGSKLYDIQLLPFCPIRSGSDRVNDAYADMIYQKSGSTYTYYSRVIWCSNTSGSYICNAPNLLGFGGNRLDPVVKNIKIENETQFYRLCSPSYSATFEYSNAKNGGTDYFIVDYYCKPINPYIHVAPHLKGLYGSSFSDARGLICNENFSLSQVTDAWVNYELQNKNYQKIFNREIKSLDLQNRLGLTQDILNATVGAGQGAMTGGYTGAQIGGGLGAGIGAATGFVMSAAGGVADVVINEQLRQDNKSKIIDIRNMQLQNIQALPYSLSKTDAFTPNNKLFPIVEVYDCTDEEKLNLARYISFNSMTVNQYGTITEYTGNTWSYEGIESRGWIKAQLLLTEYDNVNTRAYLNDETHIAQAIAEELSKGVYIK